MAAVDVAESIYKENQRLNAVISKLQSAIVTLREEVADANAELAASKRLFDEQKQILIQELDRERSRRQAAEGDVRQLALRLERKTKTASVGVNTFALSDASVGTSSADELRPPTSSFGLWPPLSRNVVTVVSPAEVGMPRRDPLDVFCDSLCSAAGCHSVDLAQFFRSIGAVTIEEVCANISEADLVAVGVPPLRARHMMQLIMSKTAEILSR